MRERAAEYKSEYVDGEIRAMTGASRRHGLIALSIGASLHAQLRGRPCEAFLSDMRVRVDSTTYVYPDVVVVCGEAKFEDGQVDTLLNPTLVVEVLSPSTADYDHRTKWEHYRGLPSLRDYLLVSQGEPRVERYTRHGDAGLWLFSETRDSSAVLQLQSIGCTLALKDIYDRVL